MTKGLDALAQLRHELRTPLNHIIGYSEMLLEEAAEGKGKELEPGLREIHEAARQVLGLVNRLLAPSAQKPAAVDLASVRGEVSPLLERIVTAGAALRGQITAAGSVHLLPDLERIQAAAASLRSLVGPAGAENAGAQPAAAGHAY